MMDLLDRLRVSSPCKVPWSAMEPRADHVRFCGRCARYVYKTEAMTSAEVRALVIRSEGRLCGRLYRRRDGTLLTADCPRGAHLRRKVSSVGGLLLGAAVTAVAALAAATSSSANGWDAIPIVRWLDPSIHFLGSETSGEIDLVDSNL